MTIVARETTERIVRFHGHMRPGPAMGIRAAEVALPRSAPLAVVSWPT